MSINSNDNFFTLYDQYSEGTESPTVFHRWSAIATLASVVGRKLWLDFGFYHIYPNMMVILVGPPALKKTTAMATGRRLLRGLELVNYSGDTVTQPKMVEDLLEARREVPLPLGGIYEHSSYSIQLTELSLLLKATDKDLPPFLIKMFDCDDEPYQYRTKNKGTYTLENYCINLLAGTTPQTIPSIFDEHTIGTGLTSRMLFIYADERRELVPFPEFTTANQQAYDKLREMIIRTANLAGPVHFSPDAKDAYKTWYVSRPSPPNESKASSYWSRKDVHIQKLMILSAAARGSRTIEIPDLEWADTQLTDIEPGIEYALATVGQNKQNLAIQTVIHIFRKAGDRPVTGAVLRKATLHMLDERQFTDMMASLMRTGSVRSVTNKESIVIGWQWTDK